MDAMMRCLGLSRLSFPRQALACPHDTKHSHCCTVSSQGRLPCADDVPLLCPLIKNDEPSKQDAGREESEPSEASLLLWRMGGEERIRMSQMAACVLWMEGLRVWCM